MKDKPRKTLRTDQDYFLLYAPPLPNLQRTHPSFSHCAVCNVHHMYVWNLLPYELRTLADINVFKIKSI